jgi:hypothetical protein
MEWLYILTELFICFFTFFIVSRIATRIRNLLKQKLNFPIFRFFEICRKIITAIRECLFVASSGGSK